MNLMQKISVAFESGEIVTYDGFNFENGLFKFFRTIDNNIVPVRYVPIHNIANIIPVYIKEDINN